jgi:hypothetical protein
MSGEKREMTRQYTKRTALPGAIARAAPQQEAPKTNEAESFKFFDRGAKVPTVTAKAMETYRAAFETIAKTRAEEIRQQVIEEAEAVARAYAEARFKELGDALEL